MLHTAASSTLTFHLLYQLSSAFHFCLRCKIWALCKELMVILEMCVTFILIRILTEDFFISSAWGVIERLLSRWFPTP